MMNQDILSLVYSYFFSIRLDNWRPVIKFSFSPFAL